MAPLHSVNELLLCRNHNILSSFVCVPLRLMPFINLKLNQEFLSNNIIHDWENKDYDSEKKFDMCTL